MPKQADAKRDGVINPHKIKQEMIWRDYSAVCNETHVTKLHRVNLVITPKTHCKPLKQWSRDENMTILELTSYSSDLDPIENVWGVSRMRSIGNTQGTLKK